LLVTSSTTETPTGGLVAAFHFQPQGISGVDTSTGTVYRGVGVTRDLFVSSPAGGFTETSVNRFHIQSTAGVESYLISGLFHLTITPDGQARVLVDKFSSTC
jgi:hypothetical protein